MTAELNSLFEVQEEIKRVKLKIAQAGTLAEKDALGKIFQSLVVRKVEMGRRFDNMRAKMHEQAVQIEGRIIQGINND